MTDLAGGASRSVQSSMSTNLNVGACMRCVPLFECALFTDGDRMNMVSDLSPKSQKSSNGSERWRRGRPNGACNERHVSTTMTHDHGRHCCSCSVVDVDCAFCQGPRNYNGRPCGYPSMDTINAAVGVVVLSMLGPAGQQVQPSRSSLLTTMVFARLHCELGLHTPERF